MACNVYFIKWEFCRIIPLSADCGISVGALYVRALQYHRCMKWVYSVMSCPSSYYEFCLSVLSYRQILIVVL